MSRSEGQELVASDGTLAFEVTARCNRKCAYCYNQWRDAPLPDEPELSTTEWGRLAARVIEESGRSHIQISGGEPLLCTDLFERIAQIRTPERRIALVTDGGLMDEAAVAEIVRLGVGPVQPTLLAGDRRVHDELKGVASFDATLAAVVRLLGKRVPISVSFVCTKKNYVHFRAMVELCFALGVRTVAWSRFCSAGAGSRREAELTPTAEMVRENLDVALWAREALKMNVAVAISLPLCVPAPSHLKHLALGRCALGTQAPGYTVDPWGRLRACSISSEILGDLRSESWSTVIARARHLYFPQATQAPSSCGTCALLERCGGGCRESARAAHGCFDSPDPLCSSSGRFLP